MTNLIGDLLILSSGFFIGITFIGLLFRTKFIFEMFKGEKGDTGPVGQEGPPGDPVSDEKLWAMIAFAFKTIFGKDLEFEKGVVLTAEEYETGLRALREFFEKHPHPSSVSWGDNLEIDTDMNESVRTENEDD